MNHKAHLIAGMSSGLVVSGVLANYSSIEVAIVGGVACFLGSEFPDLDTNSIPSLIAARVGFLASLALFYFNQFQYAALLGIVFMLIKSQPHRGLTHSYILPLALFILSWLILGNYAFYSVISSCFGVGLIVHSAVDRKNPFRLKNWYG